MVRKQWKINMFLIVLFAMQIKGTILSSSFQRPAIVLGSSTQVSKADHISLEFYAAVEAADNAKSHLQSLLHNFLENLQRNLSTSAIFNTVLAKPKDNATQYKLRKLTDLADYFEESSECAQLFAEKAVHFFEKSKNESYSLLLKLRQVPSADRFLSPAVKISLTDYFAEMESFHLIFSEIVDQALEYIVDTMRSIQRVFINYADIQRDILRYKNLQSEEWCCNAYMDFLQHWSAHIFKCGTNNELQLAYDVYALTETYTKHIMRQLEFRIQRLYNCFIFGSYEIRCRFLRKPELDFEKLLAKLDELQQYFDIRIKRGRVVINHSSRQRRYQDDVNYYDKCIPYGFPDVQMVNSLKACFHFPNAIHV